MTAIQAFLRGGGTYKELAETYFIKMRRDIHDPSLVLLKYDQINSPFAEPMVRECRGIVLDESNDWAVVSRAFDKFFNHGEQLAARIDWATARVQEKVDGSLCCLYWHKGRWRVATTGTSDASGDTDGSGRTFFDLFWETYIAYGERWPPADAVGWTFLFELTTPENRVVIPRTTRELTLLGARHWTGEHMHDRHAMDARLESIRTHVCALDATMLLAAVCRIAP